MHGRIFEKEVFIILKKIIVVVLIAAVFLTTMLMFAPIGASAYEVETEDVINDAQIVGAFGEHYRGGRYRFDVSRQGEYTPEAVAERTSSVVFTKDQFVEIYDKNGNFHYEGYCWFGYDAENGAVYFCDQTTWKWVAKYDSDKRWKIRDGESFVFAADSDGCFSMSTGVVMLPKISSFFIDTYDYIYFINDFTEEVFLSDIYIGDKTAVDVSCPVVLADYVSEPFVFDGYGLSYGEYDSFDIVEFRRSNANSCPYIHFGYHVDLVFTSEGNVCDSIVISSPSSFVIPDPPEPESEWIEFLYWEDDNANRFYPGDLVSPLSFSSAQLRAVWEVTGEFEITFKGSYIDTEVITAKWGDKITIPMPVYEGYRFNGWYESYAHAEPLYKGGETITVTKSITLYASWYKITYLTFEFYDSFTGFSEVLDVDSDIGEVKTPTMTEDRSGYNFIAWTDGVSEFKAGSSYPIAAFHSYDLRAVWKEAETTQEGERNFIVAFIADTYDELKEAVMPYLDDFTIPFLDITLADVISFLFWGAVTVVLVWIAKTLLGK